MKNAVLVLGIAVLFAGGCGQKSNKETTPETGGGEALVRNDNETENSGQSGEAKSDTLFFPFPSDIKTDIQILHPLPFDPQRSVLEHIPSDSEEWYDFYQDGTTQNYFLKKAVIKVRDVDYEYCGDDYGTTTYVESERNGFMLIKGIIPQNENIASVPVTEHKFRVGVKYEFSLNGKAYAFRSDGIILDSGIITTGERWEKVESYRLYLSEQGKDEQLIAASSEFDNGHVNLQLRWIGDLDEDGKPDFILEASDYLVYTVVLFLSSKAGDGEIVRAVASMIQFLGC